MTNIKGQLTKREGTKNQANIQSASQFKILENEGTELLRKNTDSDKITYFEGNEMTLQNTGKGDENAKLYK